LSSSISAFVDAAKMRMLPARRTPALAFKSDEVCLRSHPIPADGHFRLTSINKKARANDGASQSFSR
jgi:hypothetical protein